MVLLMTNHTQACYPPLTLNEAVAVLHAAGIWEAMRDGKHALQYVYNGMIASTELILDASGSRIEEGLTSRESSEGAYHAFLISPGVDGDYDQWIEEGSREFTAIMMLWIG